MLINALKRPKPRASSNPKISYAQL